MKKVRRIVVVLIILGAGTAGLRFAARHGIVNLNSVDVSATAPLSTDKIRIIKSFFSINRQNDREIFQSGSSQEIVFDGNTTTRPETDHGENDFLVTYDDTYYFQFRQLKTENSQRDSYAFNVSQKGSSVYLTVNIKPHGLNFTRKMNRIDQAEEFRANMPIDSAKVIYNGVELQ